MVIFLKYHTPFFLTEFHSHTVQTQTFADSADSDQTASSRSTLFAIKTCTVDSRYLEFQGTL